MSFQYEVILDGIQACILVFCRVGGMIFFNPLLSRRNVPAAARVGLVLFASLIITPTLENTYGAIAEMDTFELLFAMTSELLIGMTCGVLFQIYYYMLFMVGDMIDMGFGLSMAKTFDPTTSLQISLSGNLFQFIFIMYFFASGSHLIFLRLINASYDIVGIGAINFGENVAGFMLTAFLSVFSLAMHLALPFLAASFVLEMSMGLLMKLIPQISIFTIHFQLKMLFGFSLLFLFAGPVGEFVERYINEMMLSLQGLLQAAA